LARKLAAVKILMIATKSAVTHAPALIFLLRDVNSSAAAKSAAASTNFYIPETFFGNINRVRHAHVTML
jgi:hypothetical protein